MTQDEQNTDLANLRTYLTTYDPRYYLSADRSRHVSTTETALWVFAGKGKARGQIGSISREGETWRAQRICHGSPVTCIRTRSMCDAVAHIMSGMAILAA
jgi:hypothetical protein